MSDKRDLWGDDGGFIRMDLCSPCSIQEVEEGAEAGDGGNRTALRERVEIEQPHIPTCGSGDVLEEENLAVLTEGYRQGLVFPRREVAPQKSAYSNGRLGGGATRQRAI